MTLEAAQKIVYRELGIWAEGQKSLCAGFSRSTDRPRCERYGYHIPHYLDLPMPPLEDGLLAVILRRRPMSISPYDGYWDVYWEAKIYGTEPETDSGFYPILVETKAPDPVTAAVMAFAQYLETRLVE